MPDNEARIGNAAGVDESVLGHRLYRRYADFPATQSIADDLILRHGSFLEHGAATVGHWSPIQRAPGGTLNMEWLLQRRINRRQNKVRVAKAAAGARSTAAWPVEEGESLPAIVSSEAVRSSAGAVPARSLGEHEVHRAEKDAVTATKTGIASLAVDGENPGTIGGSESAQVESASVTQAHRDVTFRAAAPTNSHQEVTSAAPPLAINPTAGGKAINQANALQSQGTQPSQAASTSSYRIGRSGRPTFRSVAPSSNIDTTAHPAGDTPNEARIGSEAPSSSQGTSPEAAKMPENNSHELQPALPAQGPGYQRGSPYETRPIFQRTRAQRSTRVTGGTGAADAPAAALAVNETRNAATSVFPAAQMDLALPTVGYVAQPQTEAQRVFTQPELLRQPGSVPNTRAVSRASATEKSSVPIIAAQRLPGTVRSKLESAPASPVSRVQREEAAPQAGHRAGAQAMVATVPRAMHDGRDAPAPPPSRVQRQEAPTQTGLGAGAQATVATVSRTMHDGSDVPASPVSRGQREEFPTQAGHRAGAQAMVATDPPANHDGTVQRSSGETSGPSEHESFAAAPVAAAQSGDPSAPVALSDPSSSAAAARVNAPGSSTYRFLRSVHRAHALASGTHSFTESLLSRHRESSIAQRSHAGSAGSGEGSARPIVQPASRRLSSLTPELARNAATSVPVTPPEKNPPSGAEARVAAITSSSMESSAGAKISSAQTNPNQEHGSHVGLGVEDRERHAEGIDRQPLDHAAGNRPEFRVHPTLANASSFGHGKGGSSATAAEPAKLTTNRTITAEAEHPQAMSGLPVTESEAAPHPTAVMLEHRQAPDTGAVGNAATMRSPAEPASDAIRVAPAPILPVRLAPIAQRATIASRQERLPVVHAALARAQEERLGGPLSEPVALSGAGDVLSPQASGRWHHVLRSAESSAGATRMTHVAAPSASSGTIHRIYRSPSPAGPAANPGSLATSPVPPAATSQPTSLTAQGAKNIDVNQLANRVYDLLVRRLASERQRRGA